MSALMIPQRPVRRQLAGAFTLRLQIVGGGREGEGPSDAFAAAELGSLLARDSLDPAKGLFDSLADALADRIARVPRGAAVDRRRAAIGILRHVGRRVHRAQLVYEILGVVGLVGAERDRPRPIGAWLDHEIG